MGVDKSRNNIAPLVIDDLGSGVFGWEVLEVPAIKDATALIDHEGPVRKPS